jgi:hypothetical protein
MQFIYSLLAAALCASSASAASYDFNSNSHKPLVEAQDVRFLGGEDLQPLDVNIDDGITNGELIE